MQTLPKCPIRGFEDFAVWYSPGVAAPSRAIAADREAVWTHTVSVAVAAATSAQTEGLARLARTADEIAEGAARVMRSAREATAVLMREHLIPEVAEG